MSYHAVGKNEAALAAAKRAVECDPRFAEGHCQLGIVCYGIGEYGLAADHLDKALQLDQDCLPANLYKVLLLSSCPEEKHRNGRGAKVIAEKLCEQFGSKDCRVHIVLALARAECGDFEGAVQSLDAALKMLDTDGELVAECRRLRKQFEQKEVYRSKKLPF
jgi:tetratricopeptide (TPR) repeat protein